MSMLSKATGSARERHRNDFYRTIDPRCVAPLLRFVPPGSRFLEPCAGDGALIHLLEAAGLDCYGRFDLSPSCPYIPRRDAFTLEKGEGTIITNPPWFRPVLHPMIAHFVQVAEEAWLLFDSAWAATKQATGPGEQWCTDVVAVGRLSWFEGGKNDATMDCSWYRFSRDKSGPTRYHWPGRAHSPADAQGLLI